MADRLRALLFVAALLCCQPLMAHKLKVFAMTEGETIQGQAYFVGGAAASGAVIRIKDGEGKELELLKPDAEGRFEYRIESVMDYEVVADTLDGHQASWSLKATEFSPGLAAISVSPAAPSESGAGVPDVDSAQTGEGVITQEACKSAMSRQTASLSDALRACEERQRLRDILGGLGYIVGLAGMGLWWSSRRRGRS